MIVLSVEEIIMSGRTVGELEQEVERLRAENKQWRERKHKDIVLIRQLEIDIEQLRAEVERLKAIIEKHAGHDPTCMAAAGEYDCDCGFAAAIEGK